MLISTDTDLNGLVDKDGNLTGKPRDIEAPIGHAEAVQRALLARTTIVRPLKERIRLANQAAARANDRAELEKFFTEEEPGA